MPHAGRSLYLEIQYMIADQLISQLGTGALDRDATLLSTLLALRLTSIGLAKYPKLNAVLFEKITLRSSKDNLRRFRDTNLASFTSIAPFVRKVAFLPSPHSTSLSLEDFRSLLKTLAQHNGGFEGSSPTEPHPVRQYMSKYWDGNIPIADSRVELLYRFYHQRAITDKDLFETGTLLRHWIAALRSLPQVSDFTLSSLMGCHPLQPCKGEHRLLHSYPNGYAGEHCDLCLGSRVMLRKASASTGRRLCKLAGEALACAGAQIKTFTVERELAQVFNQWSSSPWDQSSLGKLKTLNIRSFAIVDEDDDDNAVGVREATLVSSVGNILQQCHENVEELDIRRSLGNDYSDYFSNALFSTFPRLHSLRLDCSYLWDTFAAALPRLSALKRLYLTEGYPEILGAIGFGDDWRPVFDAIRRRPNLLHLTFHLCYHQCSSEEEKNWGFNLVFDPTTAASETSIFPANSAKRVLFEYLLNRRNWDALMEEHWGWFDPSSENDRRF